MNKIKYIFLLSLILLIMTGCGKNKIVINKELLDNNISQNENIKSEELTETENIRSVVGIDEDYEWCEDILTDSGTVNVDASLNIPDTSVMTVLSLEEYYLTNEDKCKYLNNIFDSASIRIDMDKYPTRNRLNEEKIKYEEMLSDFENWAENLSVRQIYVNSLKEKINEIDEMLITAPDSLESDDAGDYSSNYYAGKIGNIDYSCVFENDEEKNKSSVKILQKNLKTHDNLDVDDIQVVLSPAYNKNYCVITEEEAMLKADYFIEKLGITDFSIKEKYFINFCDLNGELSGDGYFFLYDRTINDCFVDNRNLFIYSDGNNEGCSNVFSPERIEIMINDSGIVSFEYTGIMKELSVSNPVSLLSYSSAKDILRSEIKNYYKNSSGNHYYNVLNLSYIRIKNPDNDNIYSYIPAYACENNYKYTYSRYEGIMDENIYINAIDGSLIDMYGEENITTAEKAFSYEIEYVYSDIK